MFLNADPRVPVETSADLLLLLNPFLLFFKTSSLFVELSNGKETSVEEWRLWGLNLEVISSHDTTILLNAANEKYNNIGSLFALLLMSLLLGGAICKASIGAEVSSW